MAEFNDLEQRLISKIADLKFDIKRSENQENKFSSDHVRYDVTISKQYSDVSWVVPSGYQCNPHFHGEPSKLDVLLAITYDIESYISNPNLGDFCEELGYEMKDIKVAMNVFEGCKNAAETFISFEKFGFSENEIFALTEMLDSGEHETAEIEEEIGKIIKEKYPSFPEPDVPEGYVKVAELMDVQDTGDYGDELADYDCDIYDAIFEVADNNVDLYYNDLLEWVKDNYGYVEEAITEGLCDGKDFMKAIQCGQFECIRQEIYENLEDSLRYAVYSHLKSDGIYAVDDCIADFVDEMDLSVNIDRLSDLYSEIDSYIENYDGVVKVSEFYERDGYKTSHPKEVKVFPFVGDEGDLESEAKDMSQAKDVQDTPATGHDKDKGAI